VQARDTHGNNLTTGGATVLLSTDRGSLSAVADNSDGTYSATLTSTSAGAAHVTGTLNASSVGTSATVTFVPGAVDAAHSTVVASSATASTDTGNTVNVTVTVKDAHDNPIQLSHVLLTQGGTSSSISDPLGIDTDSNGQAVFTVSDTVAEPVVYSATASSTLVTQAAGVQFQPGAADHLVYGQQPTNATSGASIAPPVTVRILDAHGNLTTSTAGVTLAIKPGTGAPGATLGGTLPRAAVAGIATFGDLSIAKAGIGYELTASAASTTSADSGSFDIAPGAANAAHTTITAAPASINADGTSGNSTITVQAKDANDNNVPASAGTVTLATNLASLGSVTDNGDGTYSATLTPNNNPGTATISGQLNGVAIGHTGSVVLAPPVPVVAIDGGVPTSPTASNAATITFHATNDNSTTFECSLVATGSPDAFGPCTSPGPTSGSATYTGIADGPHTFKVRGVNGNGAGSAVTAAWTVDTQAPSVSFTTAPGAFTNNGTEPLAAAASDTTSGVTAVDFRFAATAGACPTGTLISTDTSSPFTATWTTPADGTYVLCAVAEDAVGNVSTPATTSVVVDQTKPTIALANLGTPVGTDRYVRATPALHATSSDATSGVGSVDFSFSPSGGSIASLAGAGTAGTTDPYDTTWPTGGLADGTYTVTAAATDKASNSDSASRTVIVDNTPPSASVDDPGAYGHGTLALNVTASDAGSGVDTGATVIQSSPHGANTWTTLATPGAWTPANGNYDLRALVQDFVGNTATSAVRTILIDNTPPSQSDDADAAWHRTAVTVTLTATDAESGVTLPAGVQYKVDSGSFTPGTSVLIAAPADGSNDGTHTITWHATNRAGAAAVDKIAMVKIDATPPSNVTLDAPVAGAQLRGTITGAGIAATAQDATSGIASTVFRIAAPGTLGANPCDTFGTAFSDPFATTSVADGHYDVWVAATDQAGNGRCSVLPHDVVIDNTAPVTTDNAPAGAQNHDVTVTLAATDNLTSVASTEYSLDNGATWSPGTSVTILASSGDGTKTIRYRSTDGAGNVEVAKTAQITIDTTAPAGNPNDPGNVLRGTVDLTASPTDPDTASVEFRYRLVGSVGAYTSIGTDTTAPYDVPWITNAVADGDYDVEEIVTDSVGNANTVALSAKTIDNTAPDSASVTSPAASADEAGTISLSALAHDGTSGVGAVAFQVKSFGAPAFVTVDADTSAPYTGSWNSIGSPDGPTQVRVAVTDVAGNGPFYSAPVTFTVDNTSPTLTLVAPDYARGSTNLSVSNGSADIASVTYEVSPHGAGTWTTVGSSSTAPFTAAWPTGALADGLYDVRASATDHGGNPGADTKLSVRVDNTDPTGALTAPAIGATVGGGAVALAATAGDPGGSGVASVVFQYRAGSAGPFSTAATDVSSPFTGSWDVSALPSGSYEVQVVVTDNAGNPHTYSLRTITVDSTPPTLSSFAVAPVIGGNTPLSVSTSVDTDNATYEIKPTSGSTWLQVASSSSGPSYNATFATNGVSDGTYDIRATVADQFGNATSLVVNNVQIDNTPPDVISSDPADGSMIASTDHIDLVANETIASVTQLALDNQPSAVVPVLSGSSVHFPTGLLAPGNHALTGNLVDSNGNSRPFRVNVTVTDGAPLGTATMSKNVAWGATTTLVASTGLATVHLPVGMWTAGPPDPQDFLVLSIEPVDPGTLGTSSLQFASTVIDVRLFWNLLQTDEHHFDAPIEIVMTDSTGTSAIPATFENGAWRPIPELATGGSLPAGMQDGFWRAGATVHVLTRHLTMFSLLADTNLTQIAPPRDVSGVVADDGLTVRWAPGIPGEQIANFFLYVDGQKVQTFGQRQFEVKLGRITSADPRRFTMTETNLAGRESDLSPALRAVPPLAGLTLDGARAALANRGFVAGNVVTVYAPTTAEGTVVGPTVVRVLPEGSTVDLQIGSSSVVRSPLAFRAANAPRLSATTRTLFGRVLVTDGARIDVTLDAKPYHRIQRWHFKHVGSGATILRMRLAQTLRPGTYRLYWKATADSDHSVRRELTPLVIRGRRAKVHTASTPQIVIVDGSRSTLAVAKLREGHVEKISAEETYTYASYHDVSVIVLNIDAGGLMLLKNLRTVFPQTAVIALSNRPATRAAAGRLGAMTAPASTSATKLATLIATVLKR